MHKRQLTIALGALLSAGMLMAQAATPAQQPDQNAQQPDQNAQQPQAMRAHRQMNPDRQAKRLGKKLGLSADQVSQIQPIIADRQQQMQALRADTSLSQQDRHEKMRGIAQDSKNKMEAVMNDQQKQQYEQMLAARRAHHNEKPQAQ